MEIKDPSATYLFMEITKTVKLSNDSVLQIQLIDFTNDLVQEALFISSFVGY